MSHYDDLLLGALQNIGRTLLRIAAALEEAVTALNQRNGDCDAE